MNIGKKDYKDFLIIFLVFIVLFSVILSLLVLVNEDEQNDKASFQGSIFIRGPASVFIDPTDIAFYSAITGRDYGQLRGLVESDYVELTKIIWCESRWDPGACNVEYGCGSGKGLGQIILRTKTHCEKNLDQAIDLFNPLDNLTCSLWLYLYEGTVHWEQWSGSCWKRI